jgi:hypothetical protein
MVVDIKTIEDAEIEGNIGYVAARELEFARRVARGEHPEAAARGAGFSPFVSSHIADTLMQRDDIKAAIDKYKSTATSETTITPEYIISRLRIEAEREGPGSQHSARIRAIELLGRIAGVIKDKTECEIETIHIHGVLPPEVRRIALSALSRLSDDTPDDIADAYILSSLPSGASDGG